jgi:ribosomal protein S18 acetylase RimI-like enzyme
MPEFRGRGIGTALVTQLFAEADASGRSVSIHVESNNPARRLYVRLGFQGVGEHGVYKLMERAPVLSEVGALAPTESKDKLMERAVATVVG